MSKSCIDNSRATFELLRIDLLFNLLVPNAPFLFSTPWKHQNLNGFSWKNGLIIKAERRRCESFIIVIIIIIIIISFGHILQSIKLVILGWILKVRKFSIVFC